ncbi:hypothetical protein VP02_09110 [Pseudomonas ogarae]|uniref:Uncharacterized protein n=1 Tax=Pseudomonas kilonensis TaxID=132476 RepID=A0A0F4XRG5_9PSED|nr:hypothetical protein VP02_09110 [Pseudomonas ogarae]
MRVYQFHHLGNTAFETFLLLLLSWRYVSRRVGRLLLLKHRDIIRSRLLLWRFQYRWVWQTYLSQLMSFLFSKVT